MEMQGTTTLEVDFWIYTRDNEIIFEDELGGTLTWNLNRRNIKLIKAMVEEITTVYPMLKEVA